MCGKRSLCHRGAKTLKSGNVTFGMILLLTNKILL